MVKLWDDLTATEKERLEIQARRIYDALYVYEEVTGAWDLEEEVAERIWSWVGYCQEQEEEEDE
jgi:hypothetical protein